MEDDIKTATASVIRWKKQSFCTHKIVRELELLLEPQRQHRTRAHFSKLQLANSWVQPECKLYQFHGRKSKRLQARNDAQTDWKTRQLENEGAYGNKKTAEGHVLATQMPIQQQYGGMVQQMKLNNLVVWPSSNSPMVSAASSNLADISTNSAQATSLGAISDNFGRNSTFSHPYPYKQANPTHSKVPVENSRPFGSRFRPK